jgi:hypothetical protein
VNTPKLDSVEVSETTAPAAVYVGLVNVSADANTVPALSKTTATYSANTSTEFNSVADPTKIASKLAENSPTAANVEFVPVNSAALS